MYGNSGNHYMQYPPHISPSTHLSAIPTIIHRTHSAACNSSQHNVIDVLSCSGSNFSSPSAPNTAAFISSTSCGANSVSFNQHNNLWSYNQLPNSTVVSTCSAVGSPNVQLAIGSIPGHKTKAATQDQLTRGRPILGSHNVLNEQVPSQSQQKELINSFRNSDIFFDKKQLQTEGIMQWLNKNSSTSVDVQNESK